MQRLEFSGAVRHIYGSLGVKRLITFEFFSERFFEIYSNVEFHGNQPMGAELFHVDGRTAMRMVVVTFCNFGGKINTILNLKKSWVAIKKVNS